jgi:hypothetical protein
VVIRILHVLSTGSGLADTDTDTDTGSGVVVFERIEEKSCGSEQSDTAFNAVRFCPLPAQLLSKAKHAGFDWQLLNLQLITGPVQSLQ